MKMITTPTSFSIIKISKNTRIFLAGSIIGAYVLFLYEMLPEYLFNFNYALYYVAIPLAGVISIIVVLPKFISKNKNPSTGNMSSNNLTSSLIETVPLDSIKNTDKDNLLNNKNSDGGNLSESTSNSSESVQITPQPAIDENALQEIVDKATQSIKKESVKYGETVNELKNELTTMKSNVTDLTASFETTLTDLKSFQAELANPLNFMRKYFDSIDVKSLSDPSLPLHAENLSHTTNSVLHDVVKHETINPDIITLTDVTNGDVVKPDLTNSDVARILSNQEVVNSETKLDANKTIDSTFDQTSSDNIESPQEWIMQPANQKNELTGSMTLGKLMNMMSLMEEVLQKVDRDSIGILIDQCKMMGLKPDDEHVIYNVINMMEKSGLSVDDTLIMLYKFGKMIGINDPEADLLHAKLTLNKTRSVTGKKIHARENV